MVVSKKRGRFYLFKMDEKGMNDELLQGKGIMTKTHDGQAVSSEFL